METISTNIFLALGEPTRLSIIELLASRGELTATQISSTFRSSASAISQHLKVLRQARLVSVEKRAQQRVYQLDTATLNQAQSWIDARTRQWHQRLDNLEEYVQQMPSATK